MAITVAQLRAWSPQFTAFEAEVTAASSGTLEARTAAWSGRTTIRCPDQPGREDQGPAGFETFLRAVIGPNRIVQPGVEPTAQAALSTQEAYDVAHAHLLSIILP